MQITRLWPSTGKFPMGLAIEQIESDYLRERAKT